MCYDQVLHGDPNPTSRLSGIGATGALAYQVSRFKHMHADRNRQAKRLSLWLSQHVHGSYETLAKWMLLPSCHPLLFVRCLSSMSWLRWNCFLNFHLLHWILQLHCLSFGHKTVKTRPTKTVVIVLCWHTSSWLTKGPFWRLCIFKSYRWRQGLTTRYW